MRTVRSFGSRLVFSFYTVLVFAAILAAVLLVLARP
jgi:hypothetical protein